MKGCRYRRGDRCERLSWGGGGGVFFLMIRRPPRSTQSRSSAASDVYKRQGKADVAEVTTVRNKLGYDDVQVQLITQNTGSGDKRILRVEAEAQAAPPPATTKALDAAVADLNRLESKLKGACLLYTSPSPRDS